MSEPAFGELETERQHPASQDLGSMDADAALRLMEAHEHEVFDTLVAAHDQLVLAAEQVARIYSNGGRAVFIGAGTSGGLASREVSELPATFGLPAEHFPAFLATKAPLGPAAVAPPRTTRPASSKP